VVRQMTRRVVVLMLSGVLLIAGLVLLRDGFVLRDLHDGARPGEGVAIRGTVVASRAEVVGHGYRLGLPWLGVDRLELVRGGQRTWAVPPPTGRVPEGELRTVMHRNVAMTPARYSPERSPGQVTRFLGTGGVLLFVGVFGLVVGIGGAMKARRDGYNWSQHHNWRLDPPYADRHGA
jgi:hypothetical protein